MPRKVPILAWLAVGLLTWRASPAPLASATGLHRTLAPRFEELLGSAELRDPRILDIARDHSGFLWLGTYGGVVRYDGYEFRSFSSDPEDSHSLTDDQVRRLFVDSAGTLWAGTWGSGLNRYDPGTERFTRYRHDPADPASLGNDQVRSLFEDRGGNLWVGTTNGMNELDRRTGQFRRYLYEPPRPEDPADPDTTTAIHDLVEDRDGHLWVAAYGAGLYELSEGSIVARYEHDPENPQSLSDNRVYRLAMDSDGKIWVAIWGGGLDAFDVETESFDHYRHDPKDPSSLPSDVLMNVWVDRRDEVWVIGLDAGLARLDGDTGRFVRYSNDPEREGDASRALTGAALEDTEGSLWLGTYGHGVEVWDTRKPALLHFRHASGLSDDYVLAVLEDRRGAVWVGTAHGLDRLDVATETFTSYRHDSANPNSPSSDFVYALHEDRHGILWIGTWGGGLNRFDPRTGAFTRYPCGRSETNDPAALSDCDVRVIFEDSPGNLWIGTAFGLNRLDRRTGRFRHFAHDSRDPASLSDPTVDDIAEDRDGVLWVSTLNGVNRWLPDSGGFVRYTYDRSKSGGLVHRDVNVVHPGRDRSLWLGTGGGLQRLDWDEAGSPRFSLCAESCGLPRFAVTGILEDAAGVLWLATRSDGLWMFDPKTGSRQQLDRSQGLPVGGFDTPAWRMRDGRLLLGGLDGLVILDPTTVRPNTHVPPVEITNVEVDDAPRLPFGSTVSPSSQSTREVTLLPGERRVSFDFTALDFHAPAKNRYRYRLDGFDDDWRDTDASERHVAYTNLPPGKYVFQVKGANNDGVWNEKGASISVTVMPSWWQTGWFRALSVAAVVGAGLALHRLRTKYIVQTNRRLAGEIEERKRAESELLRSQGELRSLSGRLVVTQEEERRRVARELHDGVNQQLAMLSLRLGVLAKRPPNDRDEVSRQFEELKKSALGLSRDVRGVSHRLHSSELEHLGLVQALRTECAHVEKESGIGVDLDTDEAPELPSSDGSLCLYRVAQETLLNAVKHSGASRIRVRLGATAGGMELVVSDDGAGFEVEAAKRKGGLGLTSMAERVRYLGGRFQLTSRPGSGTEVLARVPIETASGKESEEE